MNTHQGTYVDGTMTINTAHQWLQSLCPFFSADGPAQSYELMSCCINGGNGRIVTEVVGNNRHKKWGAITERHKKSSSEMIHTIIERSFQLLSTAFVAALGKRHWSTTSERDQRSCHNSRSMSKLVSCLSCSWDVAEEITAASLTPMKWQN